MHKSLITSHSSLLAMASSGYVALGACIGVWSGSVPALSFAADFDTVHLALFMITLRTSGILSMQVAGWVADRRSPVAAVLLGLAAVSVAWMTAGFAPLISTSTAAVWLVAIVAGLALGMLDVGMNALAVDVVAQSGRPLFGRLHAMFAVGALLGTATLLSTKQAFDGALMARAAAFFVVAVLTLATWWVLRGKAARPTGVGLQPAAPSGGSVVPLVAMAACVGLLESAAFDWAVFHVVRAGLVSPQFDTIGLVAVTVTMVAGRLASDPIVERWGVQRLIVACAAIAAVGYGLTVVAQGPVVLVAWLLVGLGAGALAPQIFGRAGQVAGGRGTAWAITGAYVGIIAEPLLVGGLTSQVGLQYALTVPMLASVILLGLLLRFRVFAAVASAPAGYADASSLAAAHDR